MRARGEQPRPGSRDAETVLARLDRQAPVRVSLLESRARAVVAGSVGVLFGAAALTGDYRRSGGITLALSFVDAGPWGAVGLGIVVGGVIAFGFYCFIDAYARRA